MLDKIREKLANTDHSPYLIIFGVLVGFAAGLLIIMFREFIHFLQNIYLDSYDRSFLELPALQRFFIPLLGAVFLGVLFHRINRQHRQLGVAHVMERLAYHQGQLPWRNALLQFFGAALSIGSGHSVGREGPGIHLGAANGSLLGQWLNLPYTSIRVLVACGIAASIAASFNTPLAGVIFAMEVIMLEYSISSFAPVILSAFTATAITRMMYGHSAAFEVPILQLGSLAEIPVILLLALLVGASASLFISLLRIFARFLQDNPVWLRFTLAGIITGIAALISPHTMGVGYDAVNAALLGSMGVSLLLIILVAKLIASSACIGLGLPGGLIAPTLVIGATIGSIIGLLAHQWLPASYIGSDTGLYAMLGMGAMMAATLQAPLAALLAMLELTGNPNILFPGMLAVIIASQTSRHLFGHESVFKMLMSSRGLDYRDDPFSTSLRTRSVMRAMNKDFMVVNEATSRQGFDQLIERSPQWLIIEKEGWDSVMRSAELIPYQHQLLQDEEPVETIHLLDIPARRIQATTISYRSTLQHAADLINSSDNQALIVTRGEQALGILTYDDILRSFQQRS
jgi:CIC family chloride channel protein